MTLAEYLQLPPGYTATQFPGSILIESPHGHHCGLPPFDGHGDRAAWIAAAARAIQGQQPGSVQRPNIGRRIEFHDQQGNDIGCGTVSDENETEVHVQGFLHGEEMEDWLSKSSISDLEGG